MKHELTKADIDLMITWGPCEICGAPRQSLEHVVHDEYGDPVVMLSMVCSRDVAHGPDRVV